MKWKNIRDCIVPQCTRSFFTCFFFFLIFFVGTTAYAQGNMFVIFCKPVEIIGLTFFVLCLSLALYLIVIALFKCLFKWNNTLFNMRSILFTIFMSLLLSLIYVTSQEILFVASCFQVHRAHTVGSIVKIQEETDKYQPRWWPNGDSCSTEEGSLSFPTEKTSVWLTLCLPE